MKKLINTRIILSVSVITVAAAVVVGATFSFFSDTETSQGNTLVAGALDLRIDNTSYYNGVLNQGTTWTLNDLTNQLFFNFTDVKPGDLGEDTISLHADNDSWVCANFTLTENNDNTCTSPELSADPTCSEPNGNLFDGELAQNVNFVFWADDGDNVLETGEKLISSGSAQSVLNSNITLADSTTNNLGGTNGAPMSSIGNHYIGKAWCFGTLSLTPVPAGQGVDPTVNGGVTCNGSGLGDGTQTDRLLANIQFSAVQSRNNPDFVCSPEVSPTPSVSPTPTPPQISCNTEDNIFASSFSSNNQGLRKDGSAVLANRSVPSAAFGPPQTTGAPSDVGFPAGSFFSLGFTGGNIVLGYSEPFYQNPSGSDLFVYEVTGGVYPDEKVKVEVATTALGPWFVATPNPGTRDAGFEIPIASAQFVRLTESSNIALFPNDADGYDVDAVKAFCTAQ